MKYLYLIFILTLSLQSVKSQILIGRVTDLSDKPLSEATIVITDSMYYNILITDMKGGFRALDCPDSITIRISYVGFATWQKDIVISQLKDSLLTVKLEPSNMELDDVIVTAQPPKIKKELGKFVMDNVSVSPFAKGTNAQGFLRFIPILNTATNGTVKILHRNEPATIQINGRPATMPLNLIPARNIDRIEIIAVPGAEYGGSKGGIINVVLKKEMDEGLKAVVSLSDKQSYYNTQNIGTFIYYSGKKIRIMGNVSGNNFKMRLKNDYKHILAAENKVWDIVSPIKITKKTLSASFNLEYLPTDRQTWGFQVSAFGSEDENTFHSKTVYYRTETITPDSIFKTKIKNDNPFRPHLSANVSYNLKMDNNGSKWNTNLYYGHYNNKTNTREITGEYRPNDPSGKEINATQYTSVKVDYSGLTTDLHKKFNDDNTLKSGANLYYYHMNNKLAYEQTSGTKYGPEPVGSYSFLHKEFTGAFYITYERVWSDMFETSLGIRTQYRWVNGIDTRWSNRIIKDYFHILPSVSLLFTPNDEHEFSLDLSSSVSYPSLNNLTSFKYFLSANEYSQGNPDLLASRNFDFMFSYNFFDDYSFVVDYMHDTDCWSDFVIPDKDGNIVHTQANYGNCDDIDFAFIIQKYFFNNRWMLSSDLGANYTYDKGSYKGIRIDNKNWSYNFRLSNNIFLSKDQSWLAVVVYKFSSKSRNTVTIPAHHSIEASIQKTFKNSSLSINAETMFNNKMQLSSNYAESGYSYKLTKQFYPSVSINYTYTFGNKKVRNIYERKDSNILDRIK